MPSKVQARFDQYAPQFAMPAPAIRPLPQALPDYPDPQELLKQVPGATATVPALGALGGAITGANQQQLLDQWGTAVPGMVGNFGVASNQIGSMLRGEVPQDVAGEIQRNAAYGALRGGVSGSQLHGAGLGRSLGMTSLGMINQGIGNLGQLTPVAQGALTTQPWNVGAQVPGTSDLYNPLASEEAARASYIQAIQAAQIAQQTMDYAMRAAQSSTSRGSGGVGSYELMPHGSNLSRGL